MYLAVNKTLSLMRYFILGILCIAMATSCHKHNSSNTPAPVTFEPTKQYDVKFRADNQQVIVNNFQKQDTVLSMTYYEKVGLIVRPDDYNQSWTIFFNQAYTGTALDGVLFTTPNSSGQYVYNWIESNLNNIALQSKTDTVINGNNYYNLKISRVVTFLKAYPTKAATDQAVTDFLQRKNDVVTFSCYYSYNGQSSVPVTGTANLVYTKQQ